jgi:hypothetical protein
MPATFGGTTTRLLQPLAKALRQWRQVLCSRQGFSWWSVGELFDGAADGVDGVAMVMQRQVKFFIDELKRFKRQLFIARRLGAAGGAESADISAVFGQDLFRVKPLDTRLQLLVGAPLGSLDSNVSPVVLHAPLI